MRRILILTVFTLLSITGALVVGVSIAMSESTWIAPALKAPLLAPITEPAVILAGEYQMEVPATEDNVGVVGTWYLHLHRLPLLPLVGRYEIRSRNLQVQVSGFFRVNADQISFYDDRCVSPIDQQPLPGRYTWKSMGGALMLELVQDTCRAPRSAELTKAVWVRELHRVVK